MFSKRNILGSLAMLLLASVTSAEQDLNAEPEENNIEEDNQHVFEGKEHLNIYLN